jgi:hypothetical protein
MGEIMFDRSSVIARLKTRSKSFWILAALVLLLVILFAASAGFAGVLIILGIVALVTGLYALVFKRRSWVGLPHRKSAGVMAAAGVVAFIVGGGVAGATAKPDSVPEKSAAVASPTPSASATLTATSPANSPCTTSGESRKYNDQLFICTMGSSERLVWMNETESKKVVAQKAAADKAAADKVAADKLAADKAAADKVAADKLAAEQAAAAVKAAPAPFVAPAPAAPAPYVAPAPAAPAAVYYKNCTAARAAGAAPIYQGSPGYGTHLDRDGDGIGCDK